ncbi:O-antigen polymerase family protein [Enhygromyxa salina]|uniref:O-antigen polymerase family protein n=1 Tax=Enhygromyxa salina TaxID=215803 RepID=A0A0C1ZRQ9_9BACT|nr:O-antigen ligase family protein [Enhygromyxa salina]KIG13703.1 O-antigen polymerase family protein [Enhygromyxa salina]
MPEQPSDPEADRGGSSSSGRLPWSRALLLLAVAGPALWLGGVKPWVIPAFVLVVAGLLIRRCLRSETPLRVPAGWWLGLFAAALCLVQWMPLPTALLRVLAPGLSDTVTQVLAGTELGAWNRLSIHPGQTGLEFARVLGLTGLFIAAAQLSWRMVATYVSLTGTVVALIGLTQKLIGATAIYGIYVPRQQLAGLGQALGSPLLTSFINPNHQSGLLLIGLFAAASMVVDLHARSKETRGRQPSERLADRAYLAAGAVAIQTTALVLSMSRGALASLALVGPLVLVLVLRQARTGGLEPEHGRRRRIGLGIVVLGMLALALTQGAWQQLASLRDPTTFTEKFRIAREGLQLIPMSPVLGIGRGAFVDLFPLVDSQPGAIQFTHLESTPIAFLVEWGPLPGAVIVAGIGWWWVRSFLANPSLGRRLGLCGLLALGIQSCADFSLDYLGVAAPAIALAGALGVSASGKGMSRRPVMLATLVALVLAQAVAITSIPASWSQRRPRDRAVLAGELPILPALRQTPLDAMLHLAMARELATAGEWAPALQRAKVAIRLRPASLDAHLLAATLAAELGAPLDSIAHVKAGLEGLREPVPEPLVEWLIAGVSTPEQLASLAPDDGVAWMSLARAMALQSPDHARARAAARARTHPEDPEPLRLQAALALEAGNPGLALHHARLLVALQPNDEAAHRLRANARFAHNTRKQDEAAVAELELAHAGGRVSDPGVVDELLIMGLLRLADDASLDRAELLLDGLLARRAKPQTRRRRKALAERVHSARAQSSP